MGKTTIHSEKKKNQIKAGKDSRQRGENVKNLFTSKITNTEKKFSLSKLAITFADAFNLNKDLITYVESKAFADGGNEKSVKSDVSVKFTIEDSGKPISFQDKKSESKLQINTSIKSTFGSTQAAAHPIASFKYYLSNIFKVSMNKDTEDFLYFFTHDTVPNGYQKAPTHSNNFVSVNSRRNRFSLEDIITFNKDLFESFKSFVTINAKEIIMLILSSGSISKKKDWAKAILFTDANYGRVEIYDIEKLANAVVNYCNNNPDFFVIEGRAKKDSGVTTLALFDGLINLQMKGSGDGAAYHNLQFKVGGNKIKKSLEKWGY